MEEIRIELLPQLTLEISLTMKTNNINLNGKTILVTGAAGFIGSNLYL